MITTVVVDTSKGDYADAILGDLFNSNAVIATCEGDAMEERDAYKGFLERHGYSPDAILKGHQEFNAKMELLNK
jgi:hypothetical protein